MFLSGGGAEQDRKTGVADQEHGGDDHQGEVVGELAYIGASPADLPDVVEVALDFAEQAEHRVEQQYDADA